MIHLNLLQSVFQADHGLVAHATKRADIRKHLLTTSRHIQSPNFLKSADRDLKALFDLYDTAFFDRKLTAALQSENAHPFPITYDGRLRAAGGRTIRTSDRRGSIVRYQIKISSAILFANFRTPEETAEVVGITCTDRLDALMRIMEHEMLHLAEFLAFGRSSCSAARFQNAAHQLFGHTAHKHAMLTPRIKTLMSTSFRPGHQVRFVHDGLVRRGVINRINRRATVLVEHSRGSRYSDGKRYLKFYVPVSSLQTA